MVMACNIYICAQAKFKSAVGGNLLQSWVNLTIVITILLIVYYYYHYHNTLF